MVAIDPEYEYHKEARQSIKKSNKKKADLEW